MRDYNKETAVITALAFGAAVAGVLFWEPHEHHSGAYAARVDDMQDRAREEERSKATEAEMYTIEATEAPETIEWIENTLENLPAYIEPLEEPETATEEATTLAIETTTELETETAIFTGFSDTEIKLLKVASSEAGWTGNEEMMARIMLTVLNRIYSPEFPGTIDEVLAQPEQYDCIYSELYAAGYIAPEAITALGKIYRGEIENLGEIGYCTTTHNQWHASHMEYLTSVANAEFYK